MFAEAITSGITLSTYGNFAVISLNAELTVSTALFITLAVSAGFLPSALSIYISAIFTWLGKSLLNWLPVCPYKPVSQFDLNSIDLAALIAPNP